MKKYKGDNVMIEPPEAGWGVLIFSDGLKAQISASAKLVVKEGKELVDFYLMPFEATIKKFRIDIHKDLDTSGYTHKMYPKEMVRNLNSYDPARRVFFCMLNWEGKNTEATSWFLGTEQNEKIDRLKEAVRAVKAHNEKLKEENFMMKTNVQKHIKENIEGIFKPMMPSLRSLFMAEQGQEQHERSK